MEYAGEGMAKLSCLLDEGSGGPRIAENGWGILGGFEGKKKG